MNDETPQQFPPYTGDIPNSTLEWAFHYNQRYPLHLDEHKGKNPPTYEVHYSWKPSKKYISVWNNKVMVIEFK